MSVPAVSAPPGAVPTQVALNAPCVFPPVAVVGILSAEKSLCYCFT